MCACYGTAAAELFSPAILPIKEQGSGVGIKSHNVSLRPPVYIYIPDIKTWLILVAAIDFSQSHQLLKPALLTYPVHLLLFELTA